MIREAEEEAKKIEKPAKKKETAKAKEMKVEHVEHITPKKVNVANNVTSAAAPKKEAEKPKLTEMKAEAKKQDSH